MVTMGIDASTTSTGVAVFEDTKLVYHTTIKPIGEDWRDRLFHQGPTLTKIVEEYKPKIVYMEDVPLKASGGLKTLVILGAVQGFIYGIMAAHNIRVEFLAPTQWRSRLGMYDGTKEGKTRDVLKEKAVALANTTFGLELKWFGPKSKKTEDDVAEAICIAYSQIKPKKIGK